jgi:hypothetical protein
MGCANSWVPNFENIQLIKSSKTIAYPKLFIALDKMEDVSFLIQDDAIIEHLEKDINSLKNIPTELEIEYPNNLSEAIATALDSILKVSRPIYKYMNVNSQQYKEAKIENENADYHIEIYFQGFSEVPDIAVTFDRQAFINYVLTDKSGKVIWSEAISPVYTTEFLEKIPGATAGAIRENIKEMIIKVNKIISPMLNFEKFLLFLIII